MQKAATQAGPDAPGSTPERARSASPVRMNPLPSDAAGGVRVLCVDDHAVLVEGLRAQFDLDGRIRVVGRLSSAEKLLEEVQRLKPDLILLDIELPGPDVFEMADRLRHVCPSARFIFLSAHIRDGYLAAAYKSGASGYFSKADEVEDIVSGILEVARSTVGTFALGPKVRERCSHTAGRPGIGVRPANTRPKTDPKPAIPLESLSTREMEILRLIGKGMSRNEIAQELSRSPKTIDGHQERLMKKLSIKSRADLMRFAIREGLAEA